jgi:enoyl-CoA hydratase
LLRVPRERQFERVDWLSRGRSNPANLHAQARRYRELMGREITWALPG